MYRRLSLVLIGLIFVTQAAPANDGPASNVPGLAELSRYAGEWDIRITTPNSGFSSGHTSTQWILDGRFIEQSTVLNMADGSGTMEIRTLITFDVDQNRYQSWTFLSSGDMLTRNGAWDPAKQSFQYTGRTGNMTMVTRADFSQENTETWQIAIISELGTEDVVIAGVNTRSE